MKTKKSLNFLILLIFTFCPIRAICDEIRVVSLAPVATEIIYALKAQDTLVGVTDICNLEDGRRVKRLGAYSAVSLEAVYSLKPTLVVVTEGAENQVDMFKSIGLKTYIVKTSSLDNVKKSILDLSKELGVEERAKEVIAGGERRLSDIEKARDEGAKVLLLFGDEGSHVGSSSFYGIGKATFYDDLIKKIGLNNALKQSGYNILSLEGVCSTKPNCILISTDGGDEKDIEAIRACQKGVRIKTISKTPFLYPGVKYPDIAVGIASCLSS